MASNKHWFIDLDLDADPEMGRDEATAILSDWHAGTQGFVRIEGTQVEASDLGEVLELKLRLHDNIKGVRKKLIRRVAV